jgi:hypothetical protein
MTNPGAINGEVLSAIRAALDERAEPVREALRGLTGRPRQDVR